MRNLLFILLLSTSFLSGCASTSSPVDKKAQTSDPRDPLESLNRVMWDFNYDILDRFIVKPATKGYLAITPKPVRTGLINAVDNLEEPANMLNNAMQGKIDGMMTSLARFLVNSTVGVLGVFDVASAMDLTVKEEDFGQTLGSYGLQTGPYLMLPARGPTDIRSTTGDVVDGLIFPMNVLNSNVTILSFVIKGLDARASLMEREAALDNALDPYGFVKNAYFQKLEFEVNDGVIDEDSLLDEFDDIESLLDEEY